MLKWAAIFIVVAAAASFLGFSGLAGAAVEISKVLAVVAVSICVILFAMVVTASKKVNDAFDQRR